MSFPMDRRIRESLDRWLTTPPDEFDDDSEDDFEEEPECTIDKPHNAAECNGVHYDSHDFD